MQIVIVNSAMLIFGFSIWIDNKRKIFEVVFIQLSYMQKIFHVRINCL